eukprot:SAG31_NODE_6096_length_2172_cov_1.708635_4_plen_132_part_00
MVLRLRLRLLLPPPSLLLLLLLLFLLLLVLPLPLLLLQLLLLLYCFVVAAPLCAHLTVEFLQRVARCWSIVVFLFLLNRFLRTFVGDSVWWPSRIASLTLGVVVCRNMQGLGLGVRLAALAQRDPEQHPPP